MSNVGEVRQQGVKVTLNGVERTVKYDLNSFAVLEEIYGSVDNAMKVLETGSIKAVRTILWAGLIHEELGDDGTPKISQIQVGSWIGLGDLETISKAVKAAMDTSTPKNKVPNSKPISDNPQ